MILEKKTTSESRESTIKMKGEFLQTLYNYYAASKDVLKMLEIAD